MDAQLSPFPPDAALLRAAKRNFRRREQHVIHAYHTRFQRCADAGCDGYVPQDPVSKSYLLGLTLVHLGQKVLRRLNLRNAARSSLESPASRSGECAHIAVLVGGRTLYIDQAAPLRGVSIDAPIGTLAPLHCTTLGKSLLAFQPQAVIDALLPSLNLEAFTRRTLTDIGSVTRDLIQVRERRVSFDDEEFSVGVRCIATPIFKHDNPVAAAIGLSGPSRPTASRYGRAFLARR